ncbi:MAG: bacterioferritin-associated ferredoxin [Betaproteobacteria bacterium]
METDSRPLGHGVPWAKEIDRYAALQTIDNHSHYGVPFFSGISQPFRASLAMYVCLCNAVTERQIREAVDEGVRSMRALRQQLGVASCCGRCAPYARQVLEETRACTASAAQPAAA